MEVKIKVGSKSLGDVEGLEGKVELQVGMTEVEAWTRWERRHWWNRREEGAQQNQRGEGTRRSC